MQPLAFLTRLFSPILAQRHGDKVVHALVGAAIAVVAGVMALAIIGPEAPGPIGFLAVLSAAVAKEVYDQQHPEQHTTDILDAAATVFGGLVMLPIFRLIDLWTH